MAKCNGRWDHNGDFFRCPTCRHSAFATHASNMSGKCMKTAPKKTTKRTRK